MVRHVGAGLDGVLRLRDPLLMFRADDPLLVESQQNQ
jgi:hypothetical protein